MKKVQCENCNGLAFVGTLDGLECAYCGTLYIFEEKPTIGGVIAINGSIAIGGSHYGNVEVSRSPYGTIPYLYG